jgi:hypothetical protein
VGPGCGHRRTHDHECAHRSRPGGEGHRLLPQGLSLHRQKERSATRAGIRLSTVTVTNTTIGELPVIVENEEEGELVTSNVSSIDEKAAA